MSTAIIEEAARRARNAIDESEEEIEHLDRAIGDGDHYINIHRGAEVILALCDELPGKAPSEALKAIAMKLMSTVGGASGPLLASFFLAAAKTDGVDEEPWTAETVARLVSDGVGGIQKRGKSDVGDKTMLDVLIPVARGLEDGVAAGKDIATLKAEAVETARKGMESTRDITARFGRAAFLGERAVGHIDPGAMSSYVIIRAICKD